MFRLKTKNVSPSALSLSTAAVLGLIIAIMTFAFTEKWYEALIAGFVVFLVSYGLYLYTLERFIYRKIKLIYKLIAQTKATPKEEFYLQTMLPQKTIDEVRDEVEEWAEEKTKQIEHLQTNEKFRKEFLTNLAHELRTPIFSIQGYIDTLLAGAMNDEEVKEKFLLNASKSVERLTHLVNDINQISRLESGEIPLVKEKFVMQQLVLEVYDELRMSAEKRKISLELKKGTVGSIEVYADRQRMKQVMTNLVENAIKYGKENGSVICGCYILDEHNVLIEVSDNGTGITEENLPRIFERFYRTDKSRASKMGGAGLGLSIVKHIVEAHGHNVNVRSTLGVGSSFNFTLTAGKQQSGFH